MSDEEYHRRLEQDLNRLAREDPAVAAAARRLDNWIEDEAFRARHGLPRQRFRRASITCPRCGATSYHPQDIREGYCGHCHDWTR